MTYKDPYENAYEEIRGQSIDTPQTKKKSDGYIHITPGKNAMKNGNTWNYNGAAISGNADIVAGEKRTVPVNTQNAAQNSQSTAKNLTFKKNGAILTPNGAGIVEWNKNAKDVTSGTRSLKNILAGDAYGLRPDQVGYNNENGNLTINGYDTGLNASDYAAGMNNGNSSALSNAYSKAMGEEIGWARQYADTLGIGNAVTWSDGKVLLGGTEIPYQYIDSDGHAYVKKSDLDKAAQRYKQERSIMNDAEKAHELWGRRSSDIDDALGKIVSRKQWSYDPEKDPAYQAYAKMFARNAEQAYNRAMGSGGLYGRPTSFQQYQALAGYGDTMQQLSDAVPGLAQADYSRYSDEQQRNLAAYNALAAERDREYSALYGANRDTLDRISAGEQTDYERDRAARYQNPLLDEQITQTRQQSAIGNNEVTQSDIYTAYLETNVQTQIETAKAQLTAQQLQNRKAAVANAVDAAMLRGFFTDDEAAIIGLVKGSDGKYPSPYYGEAQKALYMWQNAQKQIALDAAANGL